MWCYPAGVPEAARSSSGRARPALARVSTADAIAQALRADILDGTILAGAHLREVELADSLRVSRLSVRAALAELAFRGLVRRVPNRGVHVPILTRQDALDIYQMRSLIEGEAIRRITLDPGHLDEVSEAVEALEHLPHSAPWSEFVEADVAIHRAIVVAAGSERLARADAAFAGDKLLIVVPAQQYVSPVEMAMEHRALLDVIRGGDPDAALSRFAEHLGFGTDELMAALPDD